MANNVKSEKQLIQDKTDSIMNCINVWASFYRANPNRFARDYLNIILDKFQQIILCIMFRFSNNIYLASRGGGKSFLLSVFCVIKCILYPGSRICIASKTRKQAIEIIDKIKDILMPNSSNLRIEIKEIISNQADSYVDFYNTSKIVIVTASESARHNRATDLIVDEYRLVDKQVIDTILRKFLTSERHPEFLDKPEYKDYPREQVKELYASSCWYEAHWSYELVRSYVVNMIRGRSYFCCAMPYQLAIKEGRLSRTKIEDEMSESTFNYIAFKMEMECLFFGQGDGGLYNFDEIDCNRKIVYPFYPRSLKCKLADKRIFIPQKQQGELRILSADIALMSSTKNKNDATAIFINQMIPTGGNKYINNIVYADNNEGLRTDAEALILRRLFDDYDCDYLVLDTRGLGIGVSDALMADIYDSSTGTTYGALSCCNNDELAKRCTVKNAPKVIWSIQGSPEFNSQCALNLREALKQRQVRLLISEYEADERLSELKGFTNLSPDELLEYKLPYIHTSLLISELVNLEYETRNNVIRVKEKPGMRKDRYSSLGYNIFVSKMLERSIGVTKSKDSIEKLVLNFKMPKIIKNNRGGL